MKKLYLILPEKNIWFLFFLVPIFARDFVKIKWLDKLTDGRCIKRLPPIQFSDWLDLDSSELDLSSLLRLILSFLASFFKRIKTLFWKYDQGSNKMNHCFHQISNTVCKLSNTMDLTWINYFHSLQRINWLMILQVMDVPGKLRSNLWLSWSSGSKGTQLRLPSEALPSLCLV